MFGRRLPRQRKGRPIEAESRNRNMELLEELDSMTATPPLEIQHTAGGRNIRWAGPQPILHGKTSTAITARAGTAMGSGMVTPYQNDAGTLRALTALPDVKVWNDLGGPVDSGVYVKYAIIDDQATLITADCSGSP